MKVAMLVPMSPESAIGDVMVQAIPGLTEHWEIEVWCPEEALYRPCPVPVRPYAQPDDQLLEALTRFDLVVYVIGDSLRHSRILPLAQRLPGLVILHDASLTNLVRNAAIEQNTLGSLCERIERDYGSDDAEVMRNSDAAGNDLEWLRYCAKVPLIDIAIDGSLGVVVHSWWHARRIEGTLLGEVTVAPMPVPAIDMGFEQGETRTESVLFEQLMEDDLVLITVGAVNANRRIDVLLGAIARDPVLSNRLQLWVVGPAEDRAASDLIGLAQSLGLQNRLKITGRVGDALLEKILARADLAAALRDPVLEGQSASVLTQLLFGIPTVVFDHGHYSELPDDAVIKVDPGDGPAGVERALRALVDDEQVRFRRGELGRDYVIQSRTSAAYATALLEAGDRALSAKPLVNLTVDIRSLLRRLELHQDSAVVEKVSDLAFELFDLA